MVKRQSQTEHDRLAEKVARTLLERGYKDVRADVPDFTDPKRIIWASTGEGYIPDVTGCKDCLRIFEVETSGSIEDEHTADKWKLFDSYAEVNSAMFYVVFPKESLKTVKIKSQELNLTVNMWAM